MTCVLAGIGTAVPSHRISQADAAELTKSFCCFTDQQERLLPVLYRRTGVESRHSVLLGPANGSVAGRQSFYQPARDEFDRGPKTSKRMARYEHEVAPLAIRAAQKALQESRLPPSRVTHLITVSCSGFGAPGFDIKLMKALCLPSDLARTHIGFMGCHAALNGLRVAKSFIESDPDACVLLCAVELCSLHQQYGWNPEQIVANSLFADGAAAVVCVDESNNDTSNWRVAASGAHIVPDSEEAMSWRIGDHGFEMTLSARVPDLIRQELRPWLEGWLKANSFSISQVSAWAIHPGGPRILGACADAAGLDPSLLAASRQTLATYGNMSSPTVLFILERIRSQNVHVPCVALGFGPGLAVEATLFT